MREVPYTRLVQVGQVASRPDALFHWDSSEQGATLFSIRSGTVDNTVASTCVPGAERPVNHFSPSKVFTVEKYVVAGCPVKLASVHLFVADNERTKRMR